MPAKLTIQQLYEQYKKRLKLKWIVGDQKAQLPVQTEEQSSDSPLVGYMNLARPYPIQILGKEELNYLDSLGKNARKDTLAHLFNLQPAIIIIADNETVSEDFKLRSSQGNTNLFCSPLPANDVLEQLRYQLIRITADPTHLHGVFMEVMGIGVLITGPSGIGKSELALELINRGHRLIADDAPEFVRTDPGHVTGSCPKLLADFIEVRGLGILNIRAMFGENSLTRKKRLRLVVDIEQLSDKDIKELDRLGNAYQHRAILGVKIPKVTIPVAPGRNIAVIVEAAVRNYVLYLNGYQAAEDFMERQQQLILDSEK